MIKNAFGIACITVAVMVLFCSCASKPVRNTDTQPEHTEENEIMMIKREKEALTEFFFENQAAFEEIVLGLSVHTPPSAEMIYCQFDAENGLYWGDGFELESFDDPPLLDQCKKLSASGDHIDTIAYGPNPDAPGNYYSFARRICGSDGYPLCRIAVFHFDAAAADPNDYDEFEQLTDGWWLSVVYYDGPYIEATGVSTVGK